MRRRATLVLALAGLLLAGTGLILVGGGRGGGPAIPPAPQEAGPDAVAEFCGMGLYEHPGPKGQIFVAGRAQPYWFSSVRETFAFTRLPEEPRDVRAIYVNDMGRAASWDRPEPGTWVDATKAWYVIGSARRGGMDVKEVVPFGSEAAAGAFAAAYGGRVVRFGEMPDDYIFPGGRDAPQPGAGDSR